MPIYRYINTEFWDDHYISELPKDYRYLFLYFLTNPAANLAGVYQIKLKRVVMDTDVELSVVHEALQKFEQDGKIIYRDGWVLIPNCIKHQTGSPKIKQGIKTILANVPAWACEKLAPLYPELEIPYAYPMDTLSIPYPYPIHDEEYGMDTPPHIIEQNKTEQNKNERESKSLSPQPLALRMFREHYPLYQLSIHQITALEAAEVEETAFRDCLAFWAGHGYQERNIVGILDCYANGGYKSKSNGKHGKTDEPFKMEMPYTTPSLEEQTARLLAMGLPVSGQPRK